MSRIVATRRGSGEALDMSGLVGSFDLGGAGHPAGLRVAANNRERPHSLPLLSEQSSRAASFHERPGSTSHPEQDGHSAEFQQGGRISPQSPLSTSGRERRSSLRSLRSLKDDSPNASVHGSGSFAQQIQKQPSRLLLNSTELSEAMAQIVEQNKGGDVDSTASEVSSMLPCPIPVHRSMLQPRRVPPLPSPPYALLPS